MPFWGPDLVNKLILISISIRKNCIQMVFWAPEGHMQITIMIDTQQQYIKLNIRGEISIIVMNNFFYDYSDINQKGPSTSSKDFLPCPVHPALFHNFGCCYIILMGHKKIKTKMNNSI
jgi:hypothetical protein